MDTYSRYDESTGFLTYVTVEKTYTTRLIFLDCVCFYRLCNARPECEETASIYDFGKWLCDGSLNASVTLFMLADAVQHAVHAACDKFQLGLRSPDDWELDSFLHYMLFNRICNNLDHMSLRSLVMEFEDKVAAEK